MRPIADKKGKFACSDIGRDHGLQAIMLANLLIYGKHKPGPICLNTNQGMVVKEIKLRDVNYEATAWTLDKLVGMSNQIPSSCIN